uniref:Bm9795, isoform c n=1 Tax=Brugia malayi TaxID=6279 RepID=A0A1I9G219_BRUMA|nr:Bm9795, isoform c [Brugia malayi]
MNDMMIRGSVDASRTGATNAPAIQTKTKSLLKHSPQTKLSTNLSSQEDRRKKEQSEKDVNIAELNKNDRVNKWLILELIGKGAFGCVYKVGYHGERYALKFDLGCCAEKPLLIEKNVLELARKAKSKHICRLIDYGNYFGFEYIVMTLVGKSLRDILIERKRKKLSAGCVISVGLQCVEAIEELHRVGFIHRVSVSKGHYVMQRWDVIGAVHQVVVMISNLGCINRSSLQKDIYRGRIWKMN